MFGKYANGFDFLDPLFHDSNSTQMLSFVENYNQSAAVYNPLYVGLTLIHGATAKGAGKFMFFKMFFDVKDFV